MRKELSDKSFCHAITAKATHSKGPWIHGHRYKTHNFFFEMYLILAFFLSNCGTWVKDTILGREQRALGTEQWALRNSGSGVSHIQVPTPALTIPNLVTLGMSLRFPEVQFPQLKLENTIFLAGFLSGWNEFLYGKQYTIWNTVNSRWWLLSSPTPGGQWGAYIWVLLPCKQKTLFQIDLEVPFKSLSTRENH